MLTNMWVAVTPQSAMVPDKQASLRDGNNGWIDIVMRRSLDGGLTWDRNLTVVYRNSSAHTREYHSCQQPTPVVDAKVGKVFLMSSLDNWHLRLQESADNGNTWTPWAEARDLDASLRQPGWGLVFTGLPGGIQLQAPNPHAGRLVLCSSAYWSGGEIDKHGKILNPGDVLSRLGAPTCWSSAAVRPVVCGACSPSARCLLSFLPRISLTSTSPWCGHRYSYTILSDDHGVSWRIGSDKIQPRHTTECSVAQRFDGNGAVYVYTRIWSKTCSGCKGYGRGIAESLDGGVTWDTATLRGLPDATPDVEGSFASALVTTAANKTDGSTPVNNTCFYVSAPDGANRKNLTMWKSCGVSAPDDWVSQPVDPGAASYSAVAVGQPGSGFPILYDLWAWTNSSKSPNSCLRDQSCHAGIRFAEVGSYFGPGCGHDPC